MKSNGAAPAHTRSEVRRMRGRCNVVTEVERHRTEITKRDKMAVGGIAGINVRELRNPSWGSGGFLPLLR
jgi:hypothetical protein